MNLRFEVYQQDVASILRLKSIGQTQPERNPSLLVRVPITMTFYEKNLGGTMVNVVPREVPRPKPSGPAAPRVFALGPP